MPTTSTIGATTRANGRCPGAAACAPTGPGNRPISAAADTWIGGSPRRDETDDDPGTNAVVARTRVGAELLAAAVADGALTIERDIGSDELSAYQPHQVQKKERVKSRFEGLAAEGRIVPLTTRLRLDELGARLPGEERARQRAGTRDRVTRGTVDEPRPGAQG